MPFQKIRQERMADSAARQIEQLILRGLLKTGERLPAERDLALRMDVSRPTIREAIDLLKAKGLLIAKAGSGVYVGDLIGDTFSTALIQLFADHEEALVDYIAFRKDLEGLAAERAARFATDMDIKVIQAVFSKMEKAHAKGDTDKEAALDAEFHVAIIEASHNIFLLHMMRAMFETLKKAVFWNREVMFRTHLTRDALLDQHRAILKAIQSRDAHAARAEMSRHLTYIEDCIHEDRKARENDSIAHLRYVKETQV